LAYIGLKPKSSHTNKYSQPFELVLLHVITLYIKCLKGFHYPHLLNNYLISSTLTTSVIDPWGLCFESMGLCTRFLHHITPRLTGKPRSQIRRLSGSWRRLYSPTERIGATDYRTFFGLTGLLTRHLLGCLLIGLYLVSHATF